MSYTIHKQGNLRGEKIEYKDGIGCCVWYPFKDGEDEDMGICFDFSFSDIEDFIALLNTLKEADTDKFIPTHPAPKEEE